MARDQSDEDRLAEVQHNKVELRTHYKRVCVMIQEGITTQQLKGDLAGSQYWEQQLQIQSKLLETYSQ